MLTKYLISIVEINIGTKKPINDHTIKKNWLKFFNSIYWVTKIKSGIPIAPPSIAEGYEGNFSMIKYGYILPADRLKNICKKVRLFSFTYQ